MHLSKPKRTKQNKTSVYQTLQCFNQIICWIGRY